ncbi:hypothetical protein C2W64_04843 [Brevibacillus laterosporus]|nr:aldo/keto reductase [Brevibacillus laterosporus]RAP28409.1 hypothetical protein C2W64_04843 [Brevibacillus laterosporus]
MERVILHDDLTFSRIIHGLWRLVEWNMSKEEVVHFIESCLEMGVTTFDHADIYGGYTCEERFGEALALKPSLRENMQIVTKCGIKLMNPNRPPQKLHYYDSSKNHIVTSVDSSLQKLRTDYIDVLLIHRPDYLMDPTEVAEAFRELHATGKVRHFGVSNFTPSQFDLLQSYLDKPLVTNQLELSAGYFDLFQNGTVDHCMLHRVKPMAWSPLNGGAIFTSQTEKHVRLRNTLMDVAKEIGASSIEQVLYAWLLMHPAQIMPIAGSGKLERVALAVDSLSLQLTRENWYEILRASIGKDVD